MKKQQDYLHQTLAGTAAVVICLLLISLVPEFEMGRFQYRKVSILADVMPTFKTKSEIVDSSLFVTPVFADTCKTGIVCVEDYTSDTSGILTFMKALDSSKNSKVRIAWFGDSFVEGDIFLGPLRDSLQAVFGGSGVGFVPITSEVAGFRQTVLHSYKNWNTYSMVGEKSKDHPLGFSGLVSVPRYESQSTYVASKAKRLDIFETATLFAGNTDGASILINGIKKDIKPQKSVQKIEDGYNLKSLSIEWSDSSSADLYGVVLESNTGVSLHNFAMRGNSGIGLSAISPVMFKSYDQLQHPHLVVLQYGLNVASPKTNNYDWYIKSMSKTVAMIKDCFPGSSILIIGCPDRGENYNGTFQTMRGIKELIAVQRKLAAENQVCFWNMFEAMGGDSTMVTWAGMKKNALANKDYTHLTFNGGRIMADILMGTILYEKEKYDRKKAMKPTLKKM